MDVARAQRALQKHFGFDAFLDGQEEIIAAVLAGRDGLAVLPTGGGKSLCYQLPALCREGVTFVVSPLIALMKDQVDGLQARDIPATLINSTLSGAEQRERLARMRAGDYSLVYVAPERFQAAGFVAALEDVPVSLLAIDEAHCLSQWGHDFRPDYMRLGRARQALGNPQCVAFTATATAAVREDIVRVLSLDDPFQVVTGFARPNLSFNITPVESKSDKLKRLRAVVAEYRTGVVYCATRKRVEEVSETLASWGVNCIAYHGGMKEEEREETQNRFIRREVDVAVATNAFGMGIDRPDVRFVVHYEIPGSLEAYYQEAGRAGRDGESAHCELLFNYSDTRTQEFFIEGANPGVGLIRQVYDLLWSGRDSRAEVHLGVDEIVEAVGAKNGMAVSSALATLARAGYLSRFDVPGQRRRGTRLLRPEAGPGDLEIDEAALAEKESRDRSKLQAMVQLCYGAGCRQRALLEYFGETGAGDCGSCDVCRSDYATEARELTSREDEIVRKALAGVARMSRRRGSGWQGIFGRGRIIQMLTGSKSQEVLRVRLHELSTYGILREQGTAFLNELFHALHDAGLLETQRGEYPLVTLTARGEAAMKGGAQYRLVWPAGGSAGRGSAEVEEAGDFDPALYSALKDLRNDLATRDGVPAYLVFSNKTLEAMTRARPETLEEGLTVKGVGPAKADRYLGPFLERIAKHGAAC